MGNIEENLRRGYQNGNGEPFLGTNGLVNDFQDRLVKELQALRETHFGVHAQLTEYKVLHPRTKHSLLPFVGQAFSFLFGTVSDGDLGPIRRNLHILRRNQEGVSPRC